MFPSGTDIDIDDWRRLVYDSIRNNGFTRHGKVFASFAWGSSPWMRTVEIANRMAPFAGVFIPVEPTGRLFRLSDDDREQFGSDFAICLMVYGFDGRYNSAAIDLGIGLENMVSEMWRLQAGGKPRD